MEANEQEVETGREGVEASGIEATSGGVESS